MELHPKLGGGHFLSKFADLSGLLKIGVPWLARGRSAQLGHPPQLGATHPAAPRDKTSTLKVFLKRSDFPAREGKCIWKPFPKGKFMVVALLLLGGARL